ncbi:MAG: hypothetical protein ACT4TC_21465 [Myxococcaceae bacterium]
MESTDASERATSPAESYLRRHKIVLASALDAVLNEGWTEVRVRGGGLLSDLLPDRWTSINAKSNRLGAYSQPTARVKVQGNKFETTFHFADSARSYKGHFTMGPEEFVDASDRTVATQRLAQKIGAVLFPNVTG